MGVIQRQGFKSVIVSYAFLIIGMANSLLFYPYMLEVSELGAVYFLMGNAASFAPFLLLGFHVMYQKYFAAFQTSESTRNNLYTLTLFGPVLMVVIWLITYAMFRESIISYYQAKNDVSAFIVDMVVLLSTLLPFHIIYSFVSATLGRSAIPTLLNSLFKIFQPLFVLGYFFNLYSFNTVLTLIVIYHLILLIIFIKFKDSIGKLSVNWNLREIFQMPELKQMVSYALYGFAIGVGGIFITNIDVFMIGTLLNLDALGIYSWGLVLINAIAIPFTMVGEIANPQIAKFWHEENYNELDKLYKQSSTILLLVCLGLFLAMWLSLDDLFNFMPKGGRFRAAKITILWLGIAKIIDVASGLNNQMIAFSKNHKFFFVLILIAAVVNVTLNYFFIPLYGINGAAYSTFISLLIFNLIKYWYIKYKFNLSPVTYKFLFIPVVAIGLYWIFSLIPKTEMPVLNIALISGSFIVTYTLLSYLLNLSAEFTDLINKQTNNAMRFLKKK